MAASAFLEVGLAGSAAVTPPSLQNGVRYRTVVKVTDYVGLSVECDSDGFTVYATPPTLGSVHSLLNQTAMDGAPQIVKHLVHVKWSGFVDEESGIQSYKVALGRAGDPQGIQPFRSVGTETEAFFSGLSLPQGQVQ